MNAQPNQPVEKACATTDSACRGSHYAPAVDIVETAHDFFVTADVPGAVGNQIDVQYENGELRIHAPVASRYKPEQHSLLREYDVGDYRRTFRVGTEIDAAKIEARCTDGVLTLKLPKVEAVKPRRVAVNVA